MFQISENSGVKYYAIVLSNVRQGCCRSSEHAKLCIGGYFGQAVSVMVTADGWWSNGGRTPRVSVIDHPRKLHTHSALCGCGGRVVEILQHRACACVHTCTYYITELSHVGQLREVREKLRDKCPTSYGKRLLSLNFPNDRRE